jgi:V/A-type H+-transporting ATPase subunit D
MPKLSVPPTKSSYLALERQLAFAEEGYDLLEQKRQILIFELMSRIGRARDAERRIEAALAEAMAALRDALLEMGGRSVDQAALAVRAEHGVEVRDQPVMGIRLPVVSAAVAALGIQFGLTGTSAHADRAMRRFAEALPLVAELAELETAVLRLARELKKTARRVNALSKIFIPDYSETIAYIVSSLEERERESFIILRMIKDRLARAVEGSAAHG